MNNNDNNDNNNMCLFLYNIIFVHFFLFNSTKDEAKKLSIYYFLNCNIYLHIFFFG